MRIPPRRTSVLLAVNAVIAIACAAWGVAVLRPDNGFSDGPETAVSTTTDASALNRQPPTTAAIDQYPLFNPDRVPPIEPPASTAEGTESSPTPLLRGIVHDGATAVGAILEDPSSETRRYVRAGNLFEDWTLQEVRSRTVTVRRGSQTVEIQLPIDQRQP